MFTLSCLAVVLFGALIGYLFIRFTRAKESKEDSFSQREDLLLANPIGIDVSHWQGQIDWAKVRQSGVRFAYVKATEGSSRVDSMFIRNRQKALEAGIYVGYYHFFRPKISVDSQVQNFVRNVRSIGPGELPPLLDLEVPEDWRGISQEARIRMILSWLEQVEKQLGRRPIVYLSPSFVTDVLKHDARLRGYLLMIAHYTRASQPRVPAPWATWTFWQHSETGRVPGIQGNVDLDRFNGSEEALARLAGK